MADRLRDYQRAAVAAVQRAWRGAPERGALVVLPTGAGKTHVGMELVVNAAKAGQRVVWLAHRQELLEQARDRLVAQWPGARRRCGMVRGTCDEADRLVVFGSLDTLAQAARRKAVLQAGPVALIVVDEAHHSVAPTWRRAITSLRSRSEKAGRRPVLLGLTATPDRHDGRSLRGLWDEVYRYDVGDAQAAGHLVHYDHTVRSGIEDLVGGAVSTVLEHRRRRALVFTATVGEAQDVARRLGARGIRAAWVAGTVSAEQRRTILDSFRRGRVQVLANAQLLTEGADIPQCDMVVVARALQSRPLYQQMLGRALRPARGKDRALLVTLAARPLDAVGSR